MAAANSIITLNIGSQRIAMGVFDETSKGGLVLKQYGSTSILADPAAEAARLPQIRVAVAELAEKLDLGKSSVKYALSGQSVFTRFVKLPPLEEDNIEQLVAFEAQQHVPFPIDEVIWDWQMLPGSDGDKEVVLVAIKGDALNEVNDVVVDSGLVTSEVDASPMSLFNALRYSYPELDEATLLIDIGARTTNLIYMHGERFFTRSVAAVSGSAITTAISKEYNIPFSEAETQKISNGLVAMGSGHTSQMDEPTAALAMVIRNALSKLPAEVSRTTNYYRSQHGGTAPKKVLLAGSGANLPYTKDFLEEKIGVPVEFFNPLKRVSVGKEVDVDVVSKDAHAIGELVGLALRDVEEKAPVKIDLVPEAVQLERDNDRRKPFLILASILCMLGALLWAGSQFFIAKKAKEENAAIEQKVGVLRGPQSKIQRAQNSAKQVAVLGVEYAELVNARAIWPEVLNELNGALANESVWVVDMKPLVGYSPLAIEAGERAKVASSPISDSFSSVTSYGASSMPAPAAAPETRKRGRNRVNKPMINAIQLNGFWLENDKNDRVVYGLVEKLRSKEAGDSLFDLNNPNNRNKKLTDNQIINTLSTSIVEGVYAAPFTITLPLANPIPVR